MDDTVNLLDSELVAAGKVWGDIQRKYGHRPDTRENLMSMASEAEDRFREIGLDVVVDVISPQPSIQVIGRIDPMDHERQHFEAQKGVADELYEKGAVDKLY